MAGREEAGDGLPGSAQVGRRGHKVSRIKCSGQGSGRKGEVLWHQGEIGCERHRLRASEAAGVSLVCVVTPVDETRVRSEFGL